MRATLGYCRYRNPKRSNQNFRHLSKAARLISVPNSWPGHPVRRGVARPLVVCDARVVGTVDAGDLDQRSRCATAGAVDLELRAGHVELGPINVTLVEANVLDSDEILAGRRVGRDGKLQAVLAVGTPVPVVCCVATAEAGLVHLEPIARAIVSGDAIGCLGHVDEAGARVLDDFVVEHLETDPVARVHFVGLDVAAWPGTDVAAEIVAVDNVGEGWEIRVAVTADVSVLATDLPAVNDEDVEDVVCLSGRGQGRHDKERFHVDQDCV